MIDFTLNKNKALQVHTVGEEKTPIIVIDDFVNNVDALINFAVFSQNARETFCTQESDFYPGVRKAAPLSYIEQLKALAPIINSHFDMADKNEFDVILSAFSIACTEPDELRPIQMLPHFDTPNMNQLAMVHFLCDETHGGTSFYKHKTLGYERITKERLMPYRQAIKQQAMAQKLHKNPHYINGSTVLFEQVYSVEAKLNRVVIYPSNLLHSGNINAANGYACDPINGRLTISSFAVLR
ncbi:hypothetical protein PESP_a1358 [Pseudoalteromonas espejiana DSM 9414]|uniref:Uncharacterized protein n=1 Tax=Pseudoalteromonas espejiana TaxID=28107 RepID=A0A510XX11_9GAMM|nr:DUF6445 family protein [Pseudoalteromonas espejiana]ASM49486.1 hypothetical protein PESP_a1358 [Pseudoalteromonas espejiana DSM 9414]GEK55585.1 hypothetical protein PES01_24300 [Pseudoalteromonas espejiana]